MQRESFGHGRIELEEAQASHLDQARPPQTTQPQNFHGIFCQASKGPRPQEGMNIHPHIEKAPISIPSY